MAPSFYATALVVIGICQLLDDGWHRALVLIVFGFLSPAFAISNNCQRTDDNGSADTVPLDE